MVEAPAEKRGVEQVGTVVRDAIHIPPAGAVRRASLPRQARLKDRHTRNVPVPEKQSRPAGDVPGGGKRKRVGKRQVMRRIEQARPLPVGGARNEFGGQGARFGRRFEAGCRRRKVASQINALTQRIHGAKAHAAAQPFFERNLRRIIIRIAVACNLQDVARARVGPPRIDVGGCRLGGIEAGARAVRNVLCEQMERAASEIGQLQEQGSRQAALHSEAILVRVGRRQIRRDTVQDRPLDHLLPGQGVLQRDREQARDVGRGNPDHLHSRAGEPGELIRFRENLAVGNAVPGPEGHAASRGVPGESRARRPVRPVRRIANVRQAAGNRGGGLDLVAEPQTEIQIGRQGNLVAEVKKVFPTAKSAIEVAEREGELRGGPEEKILNFGAAEIGGKEQCAAAVAAVEVIHLDARHSPPGLERVPAGDLRGAGVEREPVPRAAARKLRTRSDVLQRVPQKIKVRRFNRCLRAESREQIAVAVREGQVGGVVVKVETELPDGAGRKALSNPQPQSLAAQIRLRVLSGHQLEGVFGIVRDGIKQSEGGVFFQPEIEA